MSASAGRDAPELFRANLDALARRSPTVAERLAAVSCRDDVLFFPSAAGPLTARIAGITLHSTYDPVREASRLIAGKLDDRTTCCIVLGLGLGYHVEEILRRHPDLPLAVIEPDLPLLVSVLHTRDLTNLLASEALLLLAATPEEVASAVESLPLGNVAIVAPPAAQTLDADYYRRAEAAITAAADRKQINVNTLERFGRIWVRNLLKNSGALVSSPGVSTLARRFAGIPALVVAAGPSLDQIEPLIPELRQRMVLLAVDSSLGTCLRQSVEPDFVVTVDPQYWNTRFFDRLRSPSSALVCEPSTNPSALRRLGLPSLFTSSLFPLGRLIESATGEKGRIGAGGSVATSAWDVARLMGCSPIYLAGLDLGFPDRRTHARGLYFEELMAMVSTRLLPTETQSFRYLTEAGPLRVPATTGGMTLTDRRMLVYTWWFERQLARPDAPVTRTLSPRGVRIEGMEYSEVASALALPVTREAIDSIRAAVRSEGPSREAVSSARQGVAGALEGLLADLEALLDCARQALRHIDGLESPIRGSHAGRRAEIASRLRALEEVDARILSSASREMAGFLMQRLISEIVGSRDAADPIEASRRLYRELERSAELHAGLVHEALREIPR